MIRYTALPTSAVRALQSGHPDAYGYKPERQISDGEGNPCRHCLRHIPAGAPMLVLAHCPFPVLQPYAETGPIFLCANTCPRARDDLPPEILTTSPDYLLKGYGADNRIVYGTGQITQAQAIPDHAASLLTREDIAYLHIRSARNNCYQLRIDRA